MPGKQSTSTVSEAVMQAFEREIEHQQELVYGVALFFECLSILHTGQPAIIETYRKQYRNIIRQGNAAVERATALLEAARKDSSRIDAVRAFVFSPCNGHPDPPGMIRRAESLIAVYRKVFPGRPLERDFESDELLVLLDAAGDAFMQFQPGA